MLKALAILVSVALAILCATALLGYSSCQHPPEYKDENTKAKKANEEYCSTPYRVFAVGLFDIKEFVDGNRDDITAVSTVFIAAFTIILGLFTISLAGSTRIAADAANLSAKAAIAVQLPIIRVVPDNLGHGDVWADGKEVQECYVPTVGLSNLGPTKAFPIEMLYGFTVGLELPSEPFYEFLDAFQVNYILEPNPNAAPRMRLTLFKPLQAGQWQKILKGNFLWFYCSIRYEDFMGEKHTHGFCWRWANVGMGLAWRIEDAPAYNRKT